MSSSVNHQENVRALIECPTCLEIYDTDTRMPKVAKPCSDNFCTKCVQKNEHLNADGDCAVCGAKIAELMINRDLGQMATALEAQPSRPPASTTSSSSTSSPIRATPMETAPTENMMKNLQKFFEGLFIPNTGKQEKDDAALAAKFAKEESAKLEKTHKRKRESSKSSSSSSSRARPLTTHRRARTPFEADCALRRLSDKLYKKLSKSELNRMKPDFPDSINRVWESIMQNPHTCLSELLIYLHRTNSLPSLIEALQENKSTHFDPKYEEILSIIKNDEVCSPLFFPDESSPAHEASRFDPLPEWTGEPSESSSSSSSSFRPTTRRAHSLQKMENVLDILAQKLYLSKEQFDDMRAKFPDSIQLEWESIMKNPSFRFSNLLVCLYDNKVLPSLICALQECRIQYADPEYKKMLDIIEIDEAYSLLFFPDESSAEHDDSLFDPPPKATREPSRSSPEAPPLGLSEAEINDELKKLGNFLGSQLCHYDLRKMKHVFPLYIYRQWGDIMGDNITTSSLINLLHALRKANDLPLIMRALEERNFVALVEVILGTPIAPLFTAESTSPPMTDLLKDPEAIEELTKSRKYVDWLLDCLCAEIDSSFSKSDLRKGKIVFSLGIQREWEEIAKDPYFRVRDLLAALNEENNLPLFITFLRKINKLNSIDFILGHPTALLFTSKSASPPMTDLLKKPDAVKEMLGRKDGVSWLLDCLSDEISSSLTKSDLDRMMARCSIQTRSNRESILGDSFRVHNFLAALNEENYLPSFIKALKQIGHQNTIDFIAKHPAAPLFGL